VGGGDPRNVEEFDNLDEWTGSKERTVSINSGRREQTRSKNEWEVGEDCGAFWVRKRGCKV
jgi:hypothetical protein